MMNKTILMLSVSCMSFIAGADLCYAGFNLYDTPPVLSAAMLKSHVSTHTSHLTAAHLSSLEDIAELTLPENSGRDREGFKPSLALPNSLGREEKTKQSSSDLIRGSRWNKSAALSDLDTPIKLEYDTFLFLPSPLRGRRKENNPVNCFLTTGAELLICDPAAATEANVTVAADRSKLVLPFQQHLRSQTVDTKCRVRVTIKYSYILS